MPRSKSSSMGTRSASIEERAYFCPSSFSLSIRLRKLTSSASLRRYLALSSSISDLRAAFSLRTASSSSARSGVAEEPGVCPGELENLESPSACPWGRSGRNCRQAGPGVCESGAAARRSRPGPVRRSGLRSYPSRTPNRVYAWTCSYLSDVMD